MCNTKREGERLISIYWYQQIQKGSEMTSFIVRVTVCRKVSWKLMICISMWKGNKSDLHYCGRANSCRTGPWSQFRPCQSVERQWQRGITNKKKIISKSVCINNWISLTISKKKGRDIGNMTYGWSVFQLVHFTSN